MDAERFDRLTRTLSSRRSVVGRLLGSSLLAALGLSITGDDVAAACPKGKKRCRKRCIPRRQCCTNANCPRGSGKVCRRGRCVCPATTKRCGPRCVSRSACCPTCPSGHLCQAGTCCVATSAALQVALGPGGPTTIQLCPNTTFLGTFTIGRNVTVVGAGPASTILDGGASLVPVVRVQSSATAVEVSGVRITNGRRASGGAGLENAGILTLTGCQVTNNIAMDPDGTGGGIQNIAGTLTLVNTTVTANSAAFGGGIANAFGTTRLQGISRVEGNTAESGGGIVNAGAAARLELHDSALVTGNTADLTNPTSGGGILNGGPLGPGTVTFSGTSRVTENQPNNCTGTTSCPS